MKTLIHERVELAQKGKNPYVIQKVKSGWIVIGDVQFLPGYCLLLADPIVRCLNDLSYESRKTFLFEMSLLGDAIEKSTNCNLLNYEILGNQETALHAHVFPRYLSEAENKRIGPVWYYDWENAIRYSEKEHGKLKNKIHQYLMELIKNNC
jgi:diadenosine tetraphosphate (Ap4A) HIT family hydrolase